MLVLASSPIKVSGITDIYIYQLERSGESPWGVTQRGITTVYSVLMEGL